MTDINVNIYATIVFDDVEPKSKIKEMRSQLGLTRHAFAKALGVSNTTVSMWEHGKTQPRPSAMKKIRDFYENRQDKPRPAKSA